MPSGTNGSWKRALVAAYTRSQCRSMVLPIATAGPPTAATIGFARLGSTLNSSTTGGSAPAGRLRKSPTSLPAVKHSCEPWSRIARTCGSASAAASAAASMTYISAVIAFFFSGRASSTCATLLIVSARIKPVVLELLPQRELGELAGRGVRQLGDEHHVVRHPPLRDLAFVESKDLFLRHFLAGLLHRDDDRPLVPLRLLDADHRRLGDGRVRHRDALEVDRADPLAARLDHVLRAVGDLHDAVRVDGRHVAGRKPLRAVLVRLQRIAALALELAVDDPGPAHLQVAERLAIPGQLGPVLADDAHVHAVDGAPLLVLERVARILRRLRMLRLEAADRAERAHLGHAPGMQHLHT